VSLKVFLTHNIIKGNFKKYFKQISWIASQMEEDQMDEASSMRGRDKNAYNLLIENRKRRGY
jgi:hypothetical protein